MNERTDEKSQPQSFEKDAFDLDQLLHPASAFKHPREVVDDPNLTMNEKRAILASWASDACAIEAAPALRQPGDGPSVRFDDIMDALKALDRDARKKPDPFRLINRARRVRDLYKKDKDSGGGIFA
jgi:hypothetical protein